MPIAQAAVGQALGGHGDSAATGATVITPIYHAEGGIPIGDGAHGYDATGATAAFSSTTGTFGGGIFEPGTAAPKPQSEPVPSIRKPLLIGSGVAVAIVGAVTVFSLVAAGSGGDGKARGAADPAPGSRPATSAAPSVPPSPPPPKPVDITSEKTDTKPLALAEAYPLSALDLGGRSYVRDRSSVNHRCSLAARGVMAQALKREGCRSVVRVTYLDKEKALAVTSGIASMPDRPVALKVSKAGDPSRYEWFRGMAGKNSQQIDQAGGYAVSTVRGRYIIYSYATYAGGKRPKPGDKTLKRVAQQFLDYSVRPIDARAHGRA
ncbi:hypothetical protein ACFQHO_17445 [Actinomadura yumaensis]|uniref:hypothetical protein n=1 Tax=Actinomadura yumaensis TaxID=111807 RepID=UPI00361CD66C